MTEPARTIPAGRVLNRRQFFHKLLAPRAYAETIAVDPQTCVASRSDCRICMDQCPFEAMIVQKGQIHVIKDQCHNCGLCVAVCPVGAVSVSSYGRQGEKQPVVDPLTQLPSPGKGRLLVVTCTAQKATVYNWASGTSRPDLITCVTFPCVAATSSLFMTGALTMGFDKVVFLCTDTGCTNGCAVQEWQPIMAAINRLNRAPDTSMQLVVIMADPAEAKTAFLSLMAQWVTQDHTTSHGTAAIAPGNNFRQNLCRSLCALTENKPAREHRFKNLALPFFDLFIDTNHCTLCGACVKNCPTHALEMNKGGDRQLFFSGHRCIGCKTCVNKCPEQAVRLHRVFDVPVIENSVKKEKAGDGQAICRNCGTPITNQSLLKKVEKDLRQKGMDKSADSVFLCANCKRKNVLSPFLNGLF